MFEFTAAERDYLTEMRALTTDASGAEVLVGLNAEETAFYMQHTRAFSQGHRNRTDSAEYLALSNRHEMARLAVIGAEVEARSDRSPRH